MLCLRPTVLAAADINPSANSFLPHKKETAADIFVKPPFLYFKENK